VPDTIRLRPAIEDLRDRPGAGLTVRDVARRYRVGEDKVRAWIARGELRAINTAAVLCGKPRWVISPDALAEFERRRAGGPPPKPKRARRKSAEIDFYPD
jgi:transposase